MVQSLCTSDILRSARFYNLSCSGWFLVKLEPMGRVQSDLWIGLEEKKQGVLTSFEWGKAM